MAIILKDCFYCGGQNQAMPCIGSSEFPNISGMYRAIFACPSCHKPFAAVVRVGAGRSVSPMSDGNIQNLGMSVEHWHPTHPPLVAPAHTPEDVSQRYIEGESSFRSKSYIAAIAMFRSALDIATKKFCDEKLKKMTLFDRIDGLGKNGKITSDMAEWAHQIRAAGNDALHDEGMPKQADAEPLRLFTEMLLKYLFELPGEVAARRKKPDTA